MKKSLLALSVAAFAAASISSASAFTVYDKDGTTMAIGGRMQAVYYSHNSGENKSTDSNDGNITATGRLNIDLRTQLTDGIAGIAFVEWNVADGDKKESFDVRDLWVGADFGQFGVLKAGRFRDAVQYVTAPTDIFDDWGCRGQMGNDDRRAGMIGYYWKGYGVDVNATFGTAKDDQQVDGAFYGEDGAEAVDIKYSYALSAGYTSPDVLFGPISFKVGFGGAQFQDEGDADDYRGNDYDSYTQWAASLSWGRLDNGLYIALMGNQRDFDMLSGSDYGDYTVTGVEFVVSYGFANGVTTSIGYEWMNIDRDGVTDGRASADVDAYTIPVYVKYQINPNFRIWAEARFDVGTDEDDNSNKDFDDVSKGVYWNNCENIFSIGARYMF